MSVFSDVFLSLMGFTRSLVHEKQPKNSTTHSAAMTVAARNQPVCWSSTALLWPLKALAIGMKSSKAMKLPM